jgi:hypothetical protein
MMALDPRSIYAHFGHDINPNGMFAHVLHHLTDALERVAQLETEVAMLKGSKPNQLAQVNASGLSNLDLSTPIMTGLIVHDAMPGEYIERQENVGIQIPQPIKSLKVKK